MEWLRSKTAVVVTVAAVAALTICLGTWQGWLAEAQTVRWVNDADDAGQPTECSTATAYADIASAVAVSADGDTVRVCEGTYAGGIVVSNKITLEGREGVDVDKIVVQVAAPGTDGITVNATNVTIRHLKLDGPAGAGTGIMVNGHDATITDVEVSEWATSGIAVPWASDTVIQDSYIHNNDPDGILLHSASGSRIVHNIIADNPRNGVRIETSDLALVQDNTISGSSLDNFQLFIGGRSHVQVLRNTISTHVGGTESNGGILLEGLPAEALVVIGGSDANANTFDGDLVADMYYIVLPCGSEATVNATHNYWKGAPVVPRGVSGVIFNDEDDVADGDCPAATHPDGAVVFHPVATGPAPTPSPSPTPTPSPTVTPTPSPSPTPTTKRTFGLVMGWNNFVWTGANDTAAETALSCIAGPPVQFGIAYHWDGTAWKRYVPGQPGITTLTTVDKYDSLLVLVTASGAQCKDMPVAP